uniref:Uncharacterized protein n=1 Tax=Parascaris univalens TaxID=6257 RepID=A0A915CI92_PARUN
HNGRTYLFSRDRVYEVWRHDNLQQKTSFYINEMFPKGPRTVSVAYTNARSGVTVLIERTNVYRFRWNRDKKHFHLARKSPQQLSKDINFIPHIGFQWSDDNQVLMKCFQNNDFVIYDAYWNVPTFKGSKEDYFRNLPNDMIGMTLKTQTLLIVYTASNTVQVYDTKKHRIVQEYPIETNKLVGCINE